MALELSNHDSVAYFRGNAEAQQELLADALEQKHAGYLAHAIGIIARAHGMTELQGKTGMARQALYRALSEDGNPRLDTLLKVLEALDLELDIRPARRELTPA